MKKQEIANNGVTLYYCKEDTAIDGKLIPANTVFDIDIDENVHYVRIQLIEYLPTINRIALTDCNKTFPQVTEVLISGDISIPNAMFPNVKSPRIQGKSILNSFYLDENTVIDLAGCTHIGPKAFSGCKACELINTEKIRVCSKDSFLESSFLKQPFINGVKVAGTILIDIDENADNVIIPSYITFVAPSLRETIKKIKTITIGNIDSWNHIYKIIESETIILSDSVGMLNRFGSLSDCKCIKVDKKNPYFSSRNGLLYNKQMTELLACPYKKTGKVTVPESVVRIRHLAFHNAKVTSIQLPSSVCVFESASFQNCRFLKEMIFTDGIVSINTAISKFDDYEDVAVCNCPKLETIVLPKTLNYIGAFFDETVMASNVIIPEGVQIIDNGALQNVTGDIKLPDSLKYIGFNNFNSVSSMTANKYIPGLLSCYDIHGFSEIRYNDIKLTIGNNVLFISKYDDTILREIEYKASLNGLTEEILKDIDEIPLSYEEASLIINNYSLRKNEKLKEYIVKESGHIGMKCIRENDANLLLNLLNTGLVSKERLKVLLHMSNDKGNTLMSAYIMEYINQSTEQEEKDFVL